MTRRILRELRIDKVAAVDRPCQEHASADIMKRAPAPILTVADLQKAISVAVESDRAHIVSCAKALGATDQLPESWSAKKADPGNTTENHMLKEIAKALGLPETATEADIAKVIADNVVKSETTAAALAKAQETVVKVQEELAKAKKPPMAEEPDGDEDCAKGVAFKTPEGVYVRKAKVGDELFSVLKGQNDRILSQAADLAKARDDAANVDFSKRAKDLGFGDEFGPTLRKAYGGDATAQIEVEKRIKGLQQQVADGALFKNFGKSSPSAGSAEEELMAKVDEIKKANPKLKPAQAYSKAYTDPDNAEIVKRMKEEASA